jgi:hypothetical protein
MSTLAILQAAQSLLQTAVNGLTPLPVVALGIPKTIVGPAVVYLFHDGYTDVEKTNDLIQRTHTIAIHVALLEPADSQATELAFCAFNDALGAAYYTNRKLAVGSPPVPTAQTSRLRQADGTFTRQSQTSSYTIAEGGTYRHRWWSLEAIELIGFVMN